MKLSYSMLLSAFAFNTGLTLPLDTTNQTFFNRALQTRYQDLMASFENWKNQSTQTAVTVVNQQYYSYPPGVVTIESATMTQGTIVYPVQVVNSQSEWDYVNQYPNTNTIIPQYIFPRREDFGLWAIPQQVNALTLNYIYSTPPLNVADYAIGTVSVINGSQTVTSSGSVFTTSMVGRYFVITDSAGNPTDFWYKITGVNDVLNTLTLQSFYEGATAATQNFIIGQCPEVPDESHIFLTWGVTSDWFAGRGELTKATQFNNMYYTGDPANAQRFGKNILGGLIGIRERYAERSDRRIISMNKKSRTNYYINWVNSIDS